MTMVQRLPDFLADGDCLFEMLSWDDQVAADPERRCSISTSSSVPSMSSPSRFPHLPIELWTAIISHISAPEDIISAWLNIRRVSRSFRSATETAMRQRLMRSAHLDFVSHHIKAVRTFPGPSSRIQLGAIETRFDRWSEDGDRVFFRDKTALERMDEFLLMHTKEDWVHRVGNYMSQTCVPPEIVVVGGRRRLATNLVSFNIPPHIITVGGMVNDTELPGLEVDYDRLEVSFLWRPMLTMFLAEEERVRHLMRTVNVRRHSRMADMREQMRTGRLRFDDAYHEGMDLIKMKEQIRRKVRCHRFQYGYQRKDNHHTRGIYLPGSAPSLGQPRRVEEHLRLAAMRDIRENLSKGRDGEATVRPWRLLDDDD